MSKPQTILELNECIKLARELDILGDYEKALSKYQTALNLVTQRKSEVSDSSLKENWGQVETLINNEIKMTQEALKFAQTFQNNDETRLERAKQEEIRNQNLMRNNQEQKNEIQYDPKWERFGGMRPFEIWEKDEPEDPKERDPDVWSPPKVKPNNKGFDRGRLVNYDPKAAAKAQAGKGQNPKGKDTGKKGGKEEEDPKKGKSAFYLHYYPNGEGPDGELIEMIEREVMERSPNVKFDDIAELEEAKITLKEAVLLPLLMPDFFRGVRRPWKGVLLYGPPGTGKTLLAKALATQGKTTFFSVSPTTFASKWKGESEKLVRILFEMARFYAPSTVFIDEVDALGQKRGDGDNEASRKVLAEMLVQMDGVSGKLDQEDLSVEELKKNIVMVMGATNLPWDLDEALRRRFEKKVYIPLPNSVGRREMFRINTKELELAKNIDWDRIVLKTEGYSGADIANVCREASLINMREVLKRTGGKLDFTLIRDHPSFVMKQLKAPVTQSNFDEAIKTITPSVSQSDVKKYEQYADEYSNK